MRFVLTDDSVDRHYERVLVSGVKTENFEKNPVMLYQHRQDSYWSDKFAPLPIGYWKDIKKEGNKITAEPVFNDTELGQQVKDLVNHGTLNACSIGFRAISYSNDPAVMMPGQKYATITEAELLECSIVMIPANPNAVMQKSFEVDGTKYNLTGTNNATPEQIAAITKAVENFHPNKQNDMSKTFEQFAQSIKSEIQKLVEVITQQKTDSSADQDSLKKMEESIHSIKSEVAKLEEENNTLDAQNKTLTGENEKLKNESEVQTKKIADLEAKLLNRGTDEDAPGATGEEGGNKVKYSYTKNHLKISK